MILDSVQLKTKYLELFSQINRNQSWLSALEHSCVYSVRQISFSKVMEVQAGIGVIL